MTQLFSDAARAELAATINDTDTIITITGGGDKFPIANTGSSAIGPGADWFKLTLWDDATGDFEIVYVRTHTSESDTFSNVLRGQEGTTAREFTAPCTVGLRPTAGDAATWGAKEPAIASGTTSQYWRGDKTFQTLDKAAVGLSNVDNTADADKPVSTLAQTALDGKVDKIAGKGLSTEDYTTAEKNKLAGIAPGATANTGTVTSVGISTPTGLSVSGSPVSTSGTLAVTYAEGYAIPTTAKQADWDTAYGWGNHASAGYQTTLVSGANVKTINGESILGSGNIGVGGVSVTLSGETSAYVSQVKTYTITNYSSFATYSVSVSAGSVSRSGDTITLTAPSSPQTITLTVAVDGKQEDFSIEVTVEPNNYIPTPAATPANFGDAFEGGFYAGMYWDQIAQSSSSKTLATGTQTFTVPDMTSAPIVYAGQSLEVRSRANPANKFIGTVTGASGTTLTLNVTSIGGSGTFSDWSIMSRFRNIVAPKASGENAGIALKNANTDFPSGCQSLVNGWAATEAMRLAGNSTEYPAAHWARGLTIGGFNDWHIPARDVLELSWRTLKPTTTANYTTADRPTAQTFDYKRDGAYGDTANTHGLNNNSSPTGAAYTSSVPGQTAAAAFQTGGAEAYEFGSAYYWSSTEYNATNAWGQYWVSSLPGPQHNSNKTDTGRVRAVRRSII